MFEFFYKWKSFYGAELFEHLKGWDDTIADYNYAHCRFPQLFLVTIGIAIVLFFLYYYVINHPRFNRWWSWLIMFLLVAAGAFGYSYYVVHADIVYNNIAPSLQYAISTSNGLLLGIYSAIMAILLFLLLTLLLRHWSSNCKHSPWKSILRKK